MAMTTMPEHWQFIAWQGFQVETPHDWNPSQLKGSAQDGYCRIDDALTPRLEVKWLRCRTEAPIGRIVDNYLAGLAKDQKRKTLPFPVRRDTRLVVPDVGEAECFEWRAASAAVNMAVLSRENRRLSVARVLFPGQDVDRPLAKRVLRSFRQHAPSEARPWSMYGLRFALPERYRLDRHSFTAGRSALCLISGRVCAEGVRLGMAAQALARKSLRELVTSDALAESWSRRTECTDAVVNGYSGLAFRVEPKQRVLRLLARRRHAVARAWHCEASNALYVAHWTGPPSQRAAFDEFAASFVCH